MAVTICRGVPATTAGEPPAVGTKLPPFTLTLPDLSELESHAHAGRES